MKKLLPLICCMFLLATSKAQYVNVPDSNFRKFLIFKYSSCFDTLGRMDTTCNLILNDSIIEIYSGWDISNIDCIQYFKSLLRFRCVLQPIITIPKLPKTVKVIECYDDLQLSNFTEFPENLETLECISTSLSQLPILPQKLKNLNIGWSKLNNLPILPDSLIQLKCSHSNISILPILPSTLEELYCSVTNLKMLPPLPNGLKKIYIEYDSIKNLPNLPDSLIGIYADFSFLENIPYLPSKLIDLYIFRTKINCLPHIPNSLGNLIIDSNLISCIPNKLNVFGQVMQYYFPFGPSGYGIAEVIPKMPLCNPSNNSNHCQSLLTNQSYTFIDLNNNNKYDTAEIVKSNVRITLSNNNYTYTNNNGIAYINADSLGSYTITATPPPFYNVVPPSYTQTFSSYDTLVMDTFALQPNVLKDSITIKLTPTNWAARAGRSYPYLVSYENVGTTVLSNAAVNLNYDNSLLSYDSSSVAGVANSGSSLSLNAGNLVPGQTGGFVAYFTVNPTAVLNSSFTSVAAITTNTVGATDSVLSIVRGSYDPNDKQATPNLTLQDVSDGKNIDYTIRFQNTGTDTAFNVVIADTLDSKLLANQVQMVGSSHPCKTTVKDNIIFFEFLDIMLPDSNINKFGSNGFVSFKIKPLSSVTAGTIIPNKAAIYFDYNSPVITKAANTIIQNPLPLQLLSFSAIPQNEAGKILVYWNTANEVNTAYFIIETSSNGTNFKAVAEVAARGIGNNSYFYSIDKSTVAYVRLKMVDKNGLYTYSNIIKLGSNVQELNGLMVLLNPTKQQLKLNVVSTKLNNTNASLTNAQGRVVKRFVLQQGYQTIDISGIAAGVYYLQSNEGSKKIVVE